ncbi:nuclear transport factor 2 family protein [Streptomyces griseoflavus]|uniref:nuclear transport factor 2 family protein n=1 Tax=Streptomyces griseoflavus TaxID=35619 RepID=UPI0034065732
MSAHTHDYDAVVARCSEAWNADGGEARAKAAAEAWTADGRRTGPVADATGHEAVTAVITSAREQFPGFAFRLLGTVDGHHDTARFSWELVGEADGPAPVAGSDVLTLGPGGRIRAVYGFLDRVPEGA